LSESEWVRQKRVFIGTRKTVDNFFLNNKELIELHDLLKVMGLCDSGGMAKTAIAAGSVKVDGNVEMRKRCKIRTGQTVEYNGRKINVI
jgi:ribosome-associated protein